MTVLTKEELEQVKVDAVKSFLLWVAAHPSYDFGQWVRSAYYSSDGVTKVCEGPVEFETYDGSVADVVKEWATK